MLVLHIDTKISEIPQQQFISASGTVHHFGSFAEIEERSQRFQISEDSSRSWNWTHPRENKLQFFFFELQISLGTKDNRKIQMVLCWAQSSPFTFIQTITNQENITYGNLIELINERFSDVDYRRKSEMTRRGVIVRNIQNFDKVSNKFRLTAKYHYGLDNIEATDKRTSKWR